MSDLLREGPEHSRPNLWIGALSFEDRCVASIVALARNEIRTTRGIVLDYIPSVSLPREAQRRRDMNWDFLVNLRERPFIEGVERIKVDAYRFQALQDILEDVLLQVGDGPVIIDITCLTKIHALTVASTLAKQPHALRWVIAYSIPESYGTLTNPSQDLPHWKDIIVAPLAETALLFNEASGRGIIIPGHEADRLILALAEIEPAGGLILIGETDRRPDLRIVTQRKNQKTIQQLTRMRASDWVNRTISITDLSGLSNLVNREIELAKKHQAPVVLFPYGPKSMLFAAAYQLASEYPESSWFVYPIPSSYDINYSSGVEETILFGPHGVA